ncbi:hypothetical protein F4802DRAFT_362805 [Xylaria palmicola]|nr:hypothetical protein F4802DRAFT_362805 [Xylaria palmicola]
MGRGLQIEAYKSRRNFAFLCFFSICVRGLRSGAMKPQQDICPIKKTKNGGYNEPNKCVAQLYNAPHDTRNRWQCTRTGRVEPIRRRGHYRVLPERGSEVVMAEERVGA